MSTLRHRPPMAFRRTNAFVLVIPVLGVLCGWMAVNAAADRTPESPSAEIPWVRTVHGWERAIWLAEPQVLFTPPIHPATVAAGLVLSAGLILGTGHAPGKKLGSTTRPAIEIACCDRL